MPAFAYLQLPPFRRTRSAILVERYGHIPMQPRWTCNNVYSGAHVGWCRVERTVLVSVQEGRIWRC